ncbi:hypothetical protein EYF80_025494 [Liparis tanakae]|uniref:Uncharacterized protein n=1 Tax=Liparis tanakae TaxID=230148 RepID=A0A4Z2HH09_9TELE|nr:hypothetical protein EYF80_025494 [Liparis tanakae]
MLHHHVSTDSVRTCRVLGHLKAKAAALPVPVWLVLLLKGNRGQFKHEPLEVTADALPLETRDSLLL